MTVAERLRSADVTAMEEVAARGTAAPDELAALVGCLGHERKAVQRPAAETFATLAARDPTARAALDGALASGSLRQRWGAAFALSLGSDPPAAIVPVLLDTLGADDGDLRWAAAAILLGLRDRDPIAAGLRRLLDAGNAAQRKMALYCLRDLGVRSPDVQSAAIGALADADEGVRLAAMAALARLATDRAAAATHLVGALETASERVRRAAAAALGVLGERTPPVVAALEAAAASPDAALARAAAGAMRALSAR
jgi:HEAT repeat protein